MYQMAVRTYVSNGRDMHQHFPFQGPPKFTQIAMFGLKIFYLATLLPFR
jgi:hypothetical protein